MRKSKKKTMAESLKSSREKVKRLILIFVMMIAILFLAAGVVFIGRNVINRAFVSDYKTGTYSKYPEKLLEMLPVGENYVVHYNLGNVEYKNGNYKKAAAQYLKALQSTIPEKKECKVRINLALAMCHEIDFDHLDMTNNEEIDKAMAKLLAARQVLTEKGCACEDVGKYTGHSKKAEELKKDIDEELNKLQDQKNQNGGSGGNNQNDPNQGQGDPNQNQGDPDENQGDPQEGQGMPQPDPDNMQVQNKLKNDLKQQKSDLENGKGANGNGGYQYEYVDPGQSSGYGEGTPW